jgi:glutamate 5-kinase
MSVDRVQLLSRVRSVVVKLGSQVLSDDQNRLDHAYLASLAFQVARLRDRGVHVTLVSSGAISAGLAEMKLTIRPEDLSQLQAVAAIGQRRLMDAWADAFEPVGLKVAQILLTRDDTDQRSRFLNLRNTIHALHGFDAVPIINENDTISTDELVRISFGDNDILAALVTEALRADLLILLSVVNGVLDSDRQPVPVFQSVEEAMPLLQTGKSKLGRGGMNSKLEAARLVTAGGDLMVIAHGREPDVLMRIVDGQDVGSLFVPRGSRRAGRTRWIGGARGKGSIIVDAGASKALIKSGKSLLPAGVIDVSGDFARGDVVDIVHEGVTIARGLSNYSSEEIALIHRKKSAEVRKLLGAKAYDEAVHRDNLVVLSQA